MLADQPNEPAQVNGIGQSLDGGAPLDLINLYDWEAAAEPRVAKHIWEFVAGASSDGVTFRRNRAAFEALALRPRYLRDISTRSLKTTLLGSEVSMPLFISPAGMQSAVHPDGVAATTRAGVAADILTIVPGRDIEVAAPVTGGVRWLQFYMADRETIAQRVARAEELGFTAVVPTVDVPFLNIKEGDRRSRFLPPYDRVLDARHPAPAVPTARMGFTWDDFEWLRGITSLPIVLKGINTAEDATLAAERGADAILVSTHGGRLFDASLSAIESLPEVVEAAGDRCEIYLDSGVRRGTDVLKALALGARAVGIGRPFFWGLAVGGESGVRGVLDLLRNEIDAAVAYCGQTDVTKLEPNLLHVPRGWGRT